MQLKLYIFSCISILKSCKLKLYSSVNYWADFCTVCIMLDKILMNEISDFFKFLVNSACIPVVLIYQM